MINVLIGACKMIKYKPANRINKKPLIQSVTRNYWFTNYMFTYKVKSDPCNNSSNQITCSVPSDMYSGLIQLNKIKKLNNKDTPLY